MNRQELLKSNLELIDPDFINCSYDIDGFTCPAGACLTPKELQYARSERNDTTFIHKLDLQINPEDLLILCHLQYSFDAAVYDTPLRDHYQKVLNYYLETWKFNIDLFQDCTASTELYHFIKETHASLITEEK